MRGAFFIAISGGVSVDNNCKGSNKKSITPDLKLTTSEFKSGG